MKRKTCKYTHRVWESVKEWTGYWQKKQNVLCASYSNWMSKLDSEMRRNAIHNTSFCLSQCCHKWCYSGNKRKRRTFSELFTFQTDLELCISVATLFISKLIHVIWVNNEKKPVQISCIYVQSNPYERFFSHIFSHGMLTSRTHALCAWVREHTAGFIPQDSCVLCAPISCLFTVCLSFPSLSSNVFCM